VTVVAQRVTVVAQWAKAPGIHCYVAGSIPAITPRYCTKKIEKCSLEHTKKKGKKNSVMLLVGNIPVLFYSILPLPHLPPFPSPPSYPTVPSLTFPSLTFPLPPAYSESSEFLKTVFKCMIK
jgi:hypothetical protein